MAIVTNCYYSTSNRTVVSFDIKAVTNASQFTGYEYRIFFPSSGIDSLWIWDAPGSLVDDTWVSTGPVIADTDWTKAEAEAAGWELQGADTSVDSFRNAFSDVANFRIDSLNVFTPGTEIGYDNIAINAIPEPASLALIGLGGFVLLRRTRRTA